MPVFSAVCQRLDCKDDYCFGAVHLVGDSYEEGIYQGKKFIRVPCDCPCHRTPGGHHFSIASGSNDA